MDKLQWLDCAMSQLQSHALRKDSDNYDDAAFYAIDCHNGSFFASFEVYDETNEYVIEENECKFNSLIEAKAWCDNHASSLSDIDYCWFFEVDSK